MKKEKIFNIYNATTNELLFSIDTEKLSPSTVSYIVCDIVVDNLYDDIDILIKVAYKN